PTATCDAGHRDTLLFRVAPWFGIHRPSKTALNDLFPRRKVKFQQRASQHMRPPTSSPATSAAHRRQHRGAAGSDTSAPGTAVEISRNAFRHGWLAEETDACGRSLPAVSITVAPPAVMIRIIVMQRHIP